MSSAIVIISALRVRFLKYMLNIRQVSMDPLLKILLWNIVILTLLRIYNFACVVCKQMEVLPVFLCRAHWHENSQTPMNKQKYFPD